MLFRSAFVVAPIPWAVTTPVLGLAYTRKSLSALVASEPMHCDPVAPLAIRPAKTNVAGNVVGAMSRKSPVVVALVTIDGPSLAVERVTPVPTVSAAPLVS